jgi:hypothetical protein
MRLIVTEGIDTVMNDLEDLTKIRNTTWKALQAFKLDIDDSKSVIRFEKLAKLFQALSKQITRLEASEPDTDELEDFINEEA